MIIWEIFLTNIGQAELPDEPGIFSLEDYADRSVFHFSGNEDQTLAQIYVSAIQSPPMATSPASRSLSRSSQRVLATLRVIRADILLDTGNRSNVHRYNLTTHVNIYPSGQLDVH